MPTERLHIGSVSRPHGILGEIKVHLAPEYVGALEGVQLVYVNDEAAPKRVRHYREHQGAALLKLAGVNDRNAAELLRGARIAIVVDDLPGLPEGEYYAHQLVGLQVRRETGEALGTLTEVLATGSNDVYIVKTQTGELLLPAIESVIKTVDFGAGIMTVAVPEGLE